jgi:organic hydroperoxide reductase OsmC/OhrA
MSSKSPASPLTPPEIRWRLRVALLVRLALRGRPRANPEELLATAYAGGFAMALSLALGKAGFAPEGIGAEARVSSLSSVAHSGSV